MALQMYFGCSGSGKSHKLYKHIIEESLLHPEVTYLFIVPEQYNLSTQRRLISMHPNKGILNIDVLSFTRLSHRVFEEVGYRSARGVTIDDIGKNLILRHIISGNEHKLTALSGVFGKLGYISEIKSVISEFMQYGIGDRELEYLVDKSSDRGILKEKLTDVQLLYREFLKYINEKYITTEEILQKVRDAVPRSGKLKKSVIILDGYTGFTPVQLDLIEELLKNCIDVYMTVLLDTEECRKRIQTADAGNGNGQNKVKGNGTPDEQDLFYLSYKTLASIGRLCRDNRIAVKEDVLLTEDIPARFMYDEKGSLIEEDSRKHELIHLEKYLFRAEDRPFVNPGNAAAKTEDESAGNRADHENSIHIFTGINPEEEATEAAVRIERLIRDKGYHYRDIAVVSGDIDTYMNACVRAFSVYDIPFFIDKTSPVLLNPMVEYIRALFDIITDSYSYESVFRYLRTMVSGYTPEETDMLENYVLRYGIRGRKQWDTPFIRKPRSMDQKELEELDSIRKRIALELKPFYEELTSGLDDPDTEAVTSATRLDVKLISTALYRFISTHGLQEKMAELAGMLDERGDKIRAVEFGKIYEEICTLLDKIVRFLPGEAVSIEEYAELLDAGFAEIRTGIIPPSDDYVQIGDIKRSRLRDIKALFFMGVNDGIIPSKASGGGIISDMEREFLTEGGTFGEKEIELAPTARMQAYTQRMYLYMLLTKPSHELYISYAALSRDGKSLNPSYLIKTIRRMFPHIITGYPAGGIKDRVYNPATGYDELTAGIQDAVLNYSDADFTEYGILLRVLSCNDEYRDRIRLMLEAAFSEGDLKRKDAISRAVARVLYGTELDCSITRLENYARCAYAHFLKYGLSLKERELFSFEAADVGSVFHDTLKTYAQILKERSIKWQEVDEETRAGIIDESIQRCIAGEDYGAIYGSFRTGYMVNRMKRIMTRTVDTLTAQLKKGRFEPYDFEFSFSSGNDYDSLNISLSEEEKVRLIGRIDRMDLCGEEDDGRIYVKIIDYKSGNKSFDLAAVYMGLDLQLVVYMNAACEYVRRRFADKEPVPAGIFYYHVDDPYISVPDDQISDEEVEEKIEKELKMTGLVNSDEKVYRLIDSDFTGRSGVIPVYVKNDGEFGRGSSVADEEEFRILSDYVNLKIKEEGREILDGNIKAEPHMKSGSDKSPCSYCDYYGVCGYRGRGSVYEDSVSDLPDGGGADSGPSDETADHSDALSGIIAAMKEHLGTKEK